MTRKIKQIYFCLLFPIFATKSYATITVDLVCEGSTRVILSNEETSSKPWTQTFSIRNGRGLANENWHVTETSLTYRQPPAKPLHPDYAFLYETIERTVEINRISGRVIQRWIFKNRGLKEIVGDYRYQIDEGKCVTSQRKF